MPGSKCCISNCLTTSKQGKSLFKFPKGELLEKWKFEMSDAELKKINLKLNPVICENHFESFFLKDVVHTNGKIKKVLAPFAYPSIFSEKTELQNFQEVQEEIEMSDHSNNCRFCLLTVDSNENSVKLTSNLIKQYESLTNSKLRKDKVYSQLVCQKCSSDLSYFAQIKSKFLKNQKKLYETFRAFENQSQLGRRSKRIKKEDEIIEDFNVKLEEESGAEAEDPIEQFEQHLYETEKVIQSDVKIDNFPEEIDGNELEEAYLELDETSTIKTSTEKPPEKYPKTLCPDCGLSISKQHLKIHQERKHLNLKRFTCDYCGREFYLLRGLRDHMKVRLLYQ